MTEINDSSAYVAGKFLGRTSIASVLSPSKTVEGSVSGVICAFLFGVAANGYIGLFTFNVAVAATLVVIAAGIIGDLVASMIKRHHGQEDFAVILVGHGGVLDIYDSMIVAVPCLFPFEYIWLG